MYVIFSVFTSRPIAFLAIITALAFMVHTLSVTNYHHHHRPEADVFHSVSVLPGLLGPS
jgi:hypothetical protein